jgi:hypothetical protein
MKGLEILQTILDACKGLKECELLSQKSDSGSSEQTAAVFAEIHSKIIAFWGFKGKEFEDLAMELRLEFLNRAIALGEGWFGPDFQGLHNLIEQLACIENPTELQMKCLQAEDIAWEMRRGLTGLAQKANVKHKQKVQNPSANNDP